MSCNSEILAARANHSTDPRSAFARAANKKAGRAILEGARPAGPMFRSMEQSQAPNSRYG
jgi:hypothetical protein